MVVLDDADIEQAAVAPSGAFTNCGQACASVERLCACRCAERFTRKVVEKQKLRVGNGLNDAIDMGPLSNPEQLEKVEAHVADAKANGADVLTGGERLTHLPGYFYAPTVLTHVTQNLRCMREETFGPILPIMTFNSDAQAVSLANDSPYGLTASVWSRSSAHAEKVARQLHAGTITINECVYTHAICQTPWGGDGARSGPLARKTGSHGMRARPSLHTHATRLKSLVVSVQCTYGHHI